LNIKPFFGRAFFILHPVTYKRSRGIFLQTGKGRFGRIDFNGVPLAGAFYLGGELGIEPILNPVTSNTRQVLTLTISLVLLVLLSGCGLPRFLGVPGGDRVLPRKGGISSQWGVLCTTKDSSGVKYHTATNDQHDAAMQAITEHCVDGWVESKRVEYASSRIVYASCLHPDGSLAISQPCEYVGDDEQVGFSEEY
jgi:hypothetical protein